jgi:hypothetical protein
MKAVPEIRNDLPCGRTRGDEPSDAQVLPGRDRQTKPLAGTIFLTFAKRIKLAEARLAGNIGRKKMSGEIRKGAGHGRRKFISPEQINWAIDLMKSVAEQQGITVILIGGVAMQAYGSPRLTKDIDFAVDQSFNRPPVLSFLGPINFGGEALVAADGTKIDVILRADEYKELYDEAN